jgi:hypothetical protein
VENLQPARGQTVHGLHEAEVALLDEVEQRQAVVEVLLGDADHEPEVRDDEPAARLARLFPAPLQVPGQAHLLGRG